MKQKLLLIVSILAALCLNGCGSSRTDPETEALREQITQLQQQVSELQEQIISESAEEPQEIPAAPEPPSEGTEDGSVPATAPDTENAPAESDPALSTTRTMEELAGLVSAFEEKVKNAVPSGNASEDIEQFLTLKQEEKQIDDQLDLHEDELEYLYRNNRLSRDEYRALERELERLEDRLDTAEDQMEYTFGIDD